MISALFLFLAIILMVIGHVFKVKRWSLLIEVYEDTSFGLLLNSLSIGHFINTIFPYRIGDLIRILLSGKKMKNGYSFSFATVVADLYVDTIMVGGFFFLLLLFSKNTEILRTATIQYTAIFILLIFGSFVCVYGRRHIKRLVSRVAAIFNDKIELALLYSTYLVIASLKAITSKIDHLRYLFFSTAMWISYLGSYAIFAKYLQSTGYVVSTSEVFATIFTPSNLYSVKTIGYLHWSYYLLIPLVICFFLSLMIKKKDVHSSCFALPQLDTYDRLTFLKAYYLDENTERLRNYLKINEGVLVIKDASSGSNASTLQIIKDGKFFYRKYAFGEDGIKLSEQIIWLNTHRHKLPLPVITYQKDTDSFSVYDMHCYVQAIGYFQYIHMMPIEKSWSLLQSVLNDMEKGLYLDKKQCDSEMLNRYIENKVVNNINKLHDNRYISALEKYDEILINGTCYNTFSHYQKMFDPDHLKQVFRNDYYSDIHGDLTIENIICLRNNDELQDDEYQNAILPKDYYLIDPNTGNIHDSPYLDYAKLLQSLHGRYEFLMMVQNVEINDNSVRYVTTNSEAYSKLYNKYHGYLLKNFSKQEIVSIYYHEIIHWLRLIPYKTLKNEKTAVVFYAGMLKVVADVWEYEHEK